MPARHLALVAKFTANNPTFTYSSENTIKGTVSCSIASGSEVAANQSITITANAKTNYHFDGWYEGATKVSADASYSFNMPASNLTLVAKFAINAYEFAYSSEDTVKGTVACDIASGTEVAYNTNITVSATPNDGYIFNGWYEGTTKVSPDAEYEFTMPNKALTLVAKFDSISLLVQAARTGEDANTLFFFNNELGLYQLDSNNEKIVPSVSPSVTFNGEPVTEVSMENIYQKCYIGIDICDYEFNTGDVAVFYAKVGEGMTANGLEFVDIRLNTDSEAVTPLNGNHLVAGKWTMCLIPAEILYDKINERENRCITIFSLVFYFNLFCLFLIVAFNRASCFYYLL